MQLTVTEIDEMLSIGATNDTSLLRRTPTPTASKCGRSVEPPHRSASRLPRRSRLLLDRREVAQVVEQAIEEHPLSGSKGRDPGVERIDARDDRSETLTQSGNLLLEARPCHRLATSAIRIDDAIEPCERRCPCSQDRFALDRSRPAPGDRGQLPLCDPGAHGCERAADLTRGLLHREHLALHSISLYLLPWAEVFVIRNDGSVI